MQFTKYEWKNQALKKKSQTYDYICLGLVFVLLIMVLMTKRGNLLPIESFWVVGAIVVVFGFLSYRVKSQDRKYKKPVRIIDNVKR